MKCNGCTTTIKNELLKLNGISAVEVFNEKDMIKVSYDSNVERKVIIDKLYSLGYPEATQKKRIAFASKKLHQLYDWKSKQPDTFK